MQPPRRLNMLHVAWRATFREVTSIGYADVAFGLIFLWCVLSVCLFSDVAMYEDSTQRNVAVAAALLLAAVCVIGVICRWGLAIPAIILTYAFTPFISPGFVHLPELEMAETQLRTVAHPTIAAAFVAGCFIAWWGVRAAWNRLTTGGTEQPPSG